MKEITQEELLHLAGIAGMTIVPEDVEELTLRFNAIAEALPPILDSLPINGVRPTPALMHPTSLPA